MREFIHDIGEQLTGFLFAVMADKEQAVAVKLRDQREKEEKRVV